MNIHSLSYWDLLIAAALVIALAILSAIMKLGMSKSILVASARTGLQLMLVGLILKTLFAHFTLGWMGLIALIMLLVAAREVMARQKRRFHGFWGFGTGAMAMFLSSFALALFALLVVIRYDPWYQPQYAVPLLGMMLGNTMNGISVGVDRLTNSAWQQRDIIETRLALGETSMVSINELRRDAIRAGLIPIINSMSVAGLVSLPGMMTGQILAGAPPVEAVKYQILIMFLLCAGTGFGTLVAVNLSAHRLFDERERLRLDRLKKA
jgi:putative ABC transport system permease protein